MSFSNPEETAKGFHPCSVWVEYKSKKKEFSYWDKNVDNEDGTTGANVSLGSNPKFILLDITFTVTGWNDPKRFKLISNELKISATKESWANAYFKVTSIPKEAMVIRFGNMTLTSIEGTWKDISDMVDSQKGKLTINAYVAIRIKGVLTMACFQFSGGSFWSFKDFYDKHKGATVHQKVVAVSGHELTTTGDNTYNVPTFAFTNNPVAGEVYTTCAELDGKLQEHLKDKYAGNHLSHVTVAEEAPAPAPKAATPAAAPSQEQSPMPTMQQAPPLPSEEDDLTAMYGEDPMSDPMDDYPF